MLRGPQSAGLLAGREDLVRAAFANSSPHHAFGRMMKVSKESIVGMVTAVETWFNKRNLQAEYAEWEAWYDYISKRIHSVEGVTARVLPPTRGVPFPILHIEWDPARIGLTGGELYELLLKGEPSIMTHAEGDLCWFVLRPAAMKPDEYKAVAERLHEVFRSAPGPKRRSMVPPKADLSGRWDVKVRYYAGAADHTLFLEAGGNKVAGSHVATRSRGEVTGTVDGDRVRLQSILPFEGTNLSYTFEGTVSGDRMSGDLSLGEYPKARWTAERYHYAARPALRDPSRSF